MDQSYSGKDFICRKDTTKRIGGGQTKNIWREKCFDKYIQGFDTLCKIGFSGFGLV